ncbi:hypothetical protein S40288_09227 [Stachybotrys chartarum IBT 40288]|nr:hypothetical protein S40288_09227 [Stachybotrys chartarum IBT 40288]
MKSILALAFPALAAAAVSYDGYKVFHVDSHNDYDAVLAQLEGLKTVDLSCADDHNHLDIAVAPQDVAAFEELGLDFTVSIQDLGVDLSREQEAVKPYVRTVKRSDAAPELPDMSYFESYHVFEEHLDYLEDVAAAFPNNSEIFVAGDSLEGRPIQGIHLWGRDGPGKQAIIWHGTVHAREWIGAPTLEYMLYQIVDGYLRRSCTSKRLLDNYDFYLMPIVNPDGFVYTHTNDRLWRKNRQVRDFNACVGTDVNRNWPYQWDVPGGSSTNPCSQTYRGEAPGDTPEMDVLTNHTLGIAQGQGLKFFVDWHSYSQLILLPYGYSCSEVADNNEYQMELATGVYEAIRSVNGLEFVYGPTCPTIYQTSGVSMDWGYDVAGAELSWGFELRPATAGQGGFVIPPENIIPSGEEMSAAVAVPGKTPGAKYNITVPHQDFPFQSGRPFWFQHDQSSFYVESKDVVYPPIIWFPPRVIDPGFLDGRLVGSYYDRPVLAKPPVIYPRPDTNGPLKYAQTFATKSDLVLISKASGGLLNASSSAEVSLAAARPLAISTIKNQIRELSSVKSIDLSGFLVPANKGIRGSMTVRRFKFSTFYHPFVTEMIKVLNQDGIEGLYQRPLQMLEVDDFDGKYDPYAFVIDKEHPVNNVDFDDNIFSVYNWKLFFHGSVTIADRLSQNQRIKEAQLWYHYVSNPTDTSPGIPTPQCYWVRKNFFQLSSAVYAERITKAILNFRAKEGDPATRSTLGPEIKYLDLLEKNKWLVMKYLDNTIAWGDSLFRGDMIELINEATQIYILASDIVGPRPLEMIPRAMPEA